MVHVLDSRRARPADPRDSNISSATVNKRRKNNGQLIMLYIQEFIKNISANSKKKGK